MGSPKALLLPVLLLWLGYCPSQVEGYFTRTVDNPEGGPAMYFLQEGRGIAKGSVLNFRYHYIGSSQPSQASFLLLLSDRQLNTYYQQMTGRPEESPYPIMCNAPSSMRLQLPSETSGHLTFTVRYTDHYALVLLQCTDVFTGGFRIKMDVDILQPDSSGRLVHHLPLEEQMLPTVYLGLLLTVIFLLVLWCAEMWMSWEHVTGVHLACAGSLVLKVIDMLVQLSYQQSLDRYGKVSAALRTGTRAASKLSTLSQLAVLFLISLGWKVTRNHISGREMRLLLVTFGLYICFSSSQAACPDDDTDKDKLCEAYVLTEYVLHSIILLGIIVSVNFNITHLRATLNDYPWSSNVPLQYRSLKQFQRFRWAFLLYLLLPTIILIIKIMVLSWAYSWLESLFKEACFLLIYALIAIDFAPGPSNLYTSMFTPDGGGGAQRSGDDDRQA